MAGLAHLRLRDFRNFRRLDVELPDGISVLRGANGQGKTNFLESIYFLAILRSFRTRMLRNLCNWEADSFFAACLLRDSRVRRMAVKWSPQRRILKADSQRIARATDFIGHLRCIALVPEDISIVSGGASERRRFIDVTLSQSDPLYLGTLRDYRKVLRLRNEVLRNPGKYKRSLMAAYDAGICRLGGEVVARRLMFIRRLSECISRIWNELAPAEWGDFIVEYHSTIDRELTGEAPEEWTEKFRERIESARARDEREGGTTIGPHRDDVRLLLNGRILSEFGSEGQRRIAAITLKLAAAEIMNRPPGIEAHGSNAVLLVDDIFGDLDETRRERVMERVMKARQAFVVRPEGAAIPDDGVGAEFEIRSGTIRRIR